MEMFDKITLFSAIKKRMAWVTQRQQVLAQDIANADTPEYRARDLKPFQFRDLVISERSALNMVATGPRHLEGRRKSETPFRDHEERHPYETMPAGNSVVLEEQMAKVNETAIAHKITSSIYRKHLGMIKTAIGKGQ